MRADKLTPETDAPVCEYKHCDSPGWVVLHFGPKKTPPLRTACYIHRGESELSDFRDDLDTRDYPPGQETP